MDLGPQHPNAGPTRRASDIETILVRRIVPLLEALTWNWGAMCHSTKMPVARGTRAGWDQSIPRGQKGTGWMGVSKKVTGQPGVSRSF